MTKRKPGAQPRNNNALKHGIYSQFIHSEDDLNMGAMSDRDPADEIAMARVNFQYAMQHREDTVDEKMQLAWDASAHYWLDTIINAKLKAKEVEQGTVSVWDTFIDAIRASNDKQAIKK